jgi:MerR family transcriptional regulator/heat shock protein HspR
MDDKNKTENMEEYEEGHEPLYTIGVVSRLLGCEPAKLRRYESAGLVQPSRTAGNTRLYSDHNLEALRRIQRLIEDDKLNAQGVRKVLELERRLNELENRLGDLEAEQDEDARG